MKQFILITALTAATTFLLTMVSITISMFLNFNN